MANFQKIRKATAFLPLSEYRLRLMVAQGTCPGFYLGREFVVNVDQLLEQLEEKSRTPSSGGRYDYARY